MEVQPNVLYLPPETLDGHTAVYHPYADVICAAGKVDRDAAITWLIPQYEKGTELDKIPSIPEFTQTNSVLKRPMTNPHYLPSISELILPLTSLTAVRFSPDGRFLAVLGSDSERDRLFVFQIRFPRFYSEISNNLLKSFLRPELQSQMLTECAWSPDSSFLAVGTQDGYLHIFNVRTHIAAQFFDSDKVRQSNQHHCIRICNGPVMGVSWSSDGYIIACQTYNEMRVLIKRSSKTKIYFSKAKTKFTEYLQKGSEKLIVGQQSIRTLYSIALYRRYCCFSPDSSFLVSTCGVMPFQADNLKSHTFCTYVFTQGDLCGREQKPSVTLPGHKNPSVAAAFSPVLYELDQQKKNLTDLPYRMLFGVASGCDVTVYDTQDFEPLMQFEGENFQLDYVTQLSFNSTGSQLLAFGAHFQYQFFDLKGLKTYEVEIVDLEFHKMTMKNSIARVKGEYAFRQVKFERQQLKTKPQKPQIAVVDKVQFDKAVKCHAVCEMYWYDLQLPINLQIEKEELELLVENLKLVDPQAQKQSSQSPLPQNSPCPQSPSLIANPTSSAKE